MAGTSLMTRAFTLARWTLGPRGTLGPVMTAGAGRAHGAGATGRTHRASGTLMSLGTSGSGDALITLLSLRALRSRAPLGAGVTGFSLRSHGTLRTAHTAVTLGTTGAARAAITLGTTGTHRPTGARGPLNTARTVGTGTTGRAHGALGAGRALNEITPILTRATLTVTGAVPGQRAGQERRHGLLLLGGSQGFGGFVYGIKGRLILARSRQMKRLCGIVQLRGLKRRCHFGVEIIF